jgi:hypothetical protein
VGIRRSEAGGSFVFLEQSHMTAIRTLETSNKDRSIRFAGQLTISTGSD